MALNMEGEERIEAPIQKVWEALNDPAVLKECIPGCQSLEKTSDNELAATVVLKIGPIKATFTGEVTLSNLKPLHGYTISGEGKGGIAGFAKGGADVTLAEDGPNTTILKYTAKADVGGKIAQLGSRLIESTSKKLAGQFFSTFNETVSAADRWIAAIPDGKPVPTFPGIALLEDDRRHRAFRFGAFLADPLPDLGRDAAVDFRFRAFRLRHDDRLARIRGLADFHLQRHLAEESDAQALGLAAARRHGRRCRSACRCRAR